ncbi:MAG: hypothetical protein AVDCRST_MAG68-1053, partial [uncultured Gemmatimonadetes bacterium]
ERRVRFQRRAARCHRSAASGKDPHHDPSGRRGARLVQGAGGGSGQRQLPVAHQRRASGARPAAPRAAGGHAQARSARRTAPSCL